MKFKLGGIVKVKDDATTGCGGSLCVNCFDGKLTIFGNELGEEEKEYHCYKGEYDLKKITPDNKYRYNHCFFYGKDLEYYYEKDKKITNWRAEFK